MNDKINNPFLKQIISEIACKTTEGRIVNVGWGSLTEAKKKKKLLRKEASNNKPADDSEEDRGEEKPQLPKLDSTVPPADPMTKGPKTAFGKPAPESPEEAPPSEPEGAPEEPAPEPAPEASPEDAEAAQADAVTAKAELEKAKAEKNKAEKEIAQQSYIKLNSNAGIQFLLGKVLDHAFKTNTIDALAGEMVQKLKIQTPEDMNAFLEETAPWRVIPGMPELLVAMKSMATKQAPTPEQPEEEEGLDENAATNELSNVTVNGKPVDLKSLTVDGVDPHDRPDFSDAYFSEGTYTDGTSLSDQDLATLSEEHGDLLNDMAHESMEGHGEDYGQDR